MASITRFLPLYWNGVARCSGISLSPCRNVIFPSYTSVMSAAGIQFSERFSFSVSTSHIFTSFSSFSLLKEFFNTMSLMFP